MIDRRKNWNTISLGRALIDQTVPILRSLPVPVAILLVQLHAPPRLGATLRLVHDTACQLVEWLQLNYAAASVDAAAVLFGAAIHDVGKALHPEELSEPGSAHVEAGYRLLVANGVSADLARFTRTHMDWDERSELEDLLVCLAGKVWKAERMPELEQLVTRRLSTACDVEPWQVFLDLNDELTRIAADADRRLAFQARYAITT
ncbi:HD domain-containing protein [Nocardia brasiliensis]|uniref:HD domain-containing protein n=1 Tax=Nocardia brasiliensis TaxID=37326 RepID=UPI003D8EDF0C